MKQLIVLVATCLMLASCEDTYSPKRKGYPRVDLPVKKYQTFDAPNFPYSFDYPVYGKVVRDTSFFGDKTENPYWINIDFPSLGGKIFISYKIIGPSYSINKLIEDAFAMTYKHSVKADAIEDNTYMDPTHKKYGVFYDVSGNAATAKQFYITDSTHHFLRGALYFDVAPNADSLKLINDFLEKDMQRLVESLQWK